MPQLRFPAALLASTAALAAAMPAAAAPFFDRIASFPVARNLPAGSDPATPTSAEIVAASGDGMTLVYYRQPEQGGRLHRHRRPRRPGRAWQPRLRRRADRRVDP